MKTFIKHRVNTIEELKGINPSWGVEVDLRSAVGRAGKLHLSHDPWVEGDDFEVWLQAFRAQKVAGTLILNTKEDGLEGRTLELLARYGVTDYFFLDTALPTLVRWSLRQGNSHFALRVSTHEPIDLLSSFAGKASWVWVDCFDGIPMPTNAIRELKGKFKICLVSPELQGQPKDRIPEFRELFSLADAVCTKHPEAWSKL